jgi:hypothetical protein
MALASLASAVLVQLTMALLEVAPVVLLQLVVLVLAHLVALVLVHLALPRVVLPARDLWTLVLLAPLALVALVAPLVVFRGVPPAMPLDLDLSAVMQRVKLPGPVPSARVPLAPILPTRVLLGLAFLAAAPLVLAVPDLVRLAQASLAA